MRSKLPQFRRVARLSATATGAIVRPERAITPNSTPIDHELHRKVSQQGFDHALFVYAKAAS